MIGNKLDLVDTSTRAVTTQEGKQFALDNNLTFYEVSAKSEENIVQAASDLYLQMYLKANAVGASSVFKYIAIGESGVGKSSLMKRFNGCRIDLSGLPPHIKPPSPIHINTNTNTRPFQPPRKPLLPAGTSKVIGGIVLLYGIMKSGYLVHLVVFIMLGCALMLVWKWEEMLNFKMREPEVTLKGIESSVNVSSIAPPVVNVWKMDNESKNEEVEIHTQNYWNKVNELLKPKEMCS
uniref:Uncharacterized protein n=1 Tax=Arcella intermedia TaxID=1963864 RepID=A0A6B2LF63_9EUKA